jgi:hypothetical protein
VAGEAGFLAEGNTGRIDHQTARADVAAQDGKFWIVAN